MKKSPSGWIVSPRLERALDRRARGGVQRQPFLSTA
jgi:hypothetical protein